MPNPEFRLIQGEASTPNRFKAFVIAHSVEIRDPDTPRRGIYILNDSAQIVPIDEVVFKVMDVEGTGADTYYIMLNRSAEAITAHEVWYDDEPSAPQFYDEAMNPVQESEAGRVLDKLAEAEAAGRLTQSSIDPN